MTNAPDLTAAGIDFLVTDPNRQNLDTTILTGVVVDGTDPSRVLVKCDGDTTILTMVSTIGQLPTGAQVSIINITTKGLFIIGSQTRALSAATIPSYVDFGAAPSPGTTAPYTSLLLHDTFNRGTITGSWGSPDVAPAVGMSWDTVANVLNTVNVGPGYGEFLIPTPVFPTTAIIHCFVEAEARNHSRWVKNIQADFDPGGAPIRPVSGTFALNHTFSTGQQSVVPTLRFYRDGTTSVIITASVAPDSAEVFIPGVTAHQPVDILGKWYQTEVQVWVALTSDGIDPESPPTVVYPNVPGVSTSQPLNVPDQLTFSVEGASPAFTQSGSLRVGEIICKLISWPRTFTP